MAGDGAEHGFVCDAPLRTRQNGGADAVPYRRGACFAALRILRVCLHDSAHLVLGQFLGGIVQKRRQCGLLRVGAVVLGQFDGHFFHVDGMLVALIAQAAAHKFLCLFQLHLSATSFCVPV